MSRQEYDCCEQHIEAGHARHCRFHPDNVLLEGLVGTRHRDLYRNNAPFKHSIDTLVKILPAMLSRLNSTQWGQISTMLPTMVDGLAEHSRGLQAEFDKRMQAAMLQPVTLTMVSDLAPKDPGAGK